MMDGMTNRTSQLDTRTTLNVIVLLLLSLNGVMTVSDANFWNDAAQETLKKNVNRKENTNVAKNVIMFLGDGMGMSTVTASRIYQGQKLGTSGEESQLTFEKFPYTGLIKTYTTDHQTPDSAGAATAFLCGVKTRTGLLGLDDNAVRANCSSALGNHVDSILHWSMLKGKSTGIVTTARLTHATPAAGYAHIAERDWEGDTSLPMEAKTAGCKDIAFQLIMENKHIQVLLGGGRSYFLNNSTLDPETNDTDNHREDMDLTQEWEKEKEFNNHTYKYVWRKKEFDMVNPEDTDFLLGLFSPSHMQYESDRDKGPNGEPSLKEMTEKAIKILSRNEKGFFLLIEAGRIDHAHHKTFAQRALLETVAFDEAIQGAVSLTDQNDTLIVVTADHSHVFTMGAYSSRGNDILGEVDDKEKIPTDNLTYTTLTYANGPRQRQNITGLDLHDFEFRQEASVPLQDETHAGEDVPLYASGPMAHIFTGTNEQNYIAHAMAFASCVGANENHCNSKYTSSAIRPIVYNFYLCLSFFMLLIFKVVLF